MLLLLRSVISYPQAHTCTYIDMHVHVCVYTCVHTCNILLCVLVGDMYFSGLASKVNGFWIAFQSLPQEQQGWDASRKLRSELQQYREVLPLLKNLHSKVW